MLVLKYHYFFFFKLGEKRITLNIYSNICIFEKHIAFKHDSIVISDNSLIQTKYTK